MIRHGCLMLALAAAMLVQAPALAQPLAPGQGRQDFAVWIIAPGRAAAVRGFEDYLKGARVDGVLPTYQLLRTASDWAECRGAPFAVAPRSLWPSIVNTLGLIREQVKPALGEVEALSGYREPALNLCAKGKPGSAHALFYALDLTPLAAISRDRMIERMCKLHARVGPRWRWGLGFYSGLRFHVDTRRYRRWGSDGRGITSPCVAYDGTR